MHIRRQEVLTGLKPNTIGKTIKHLRGFLKDRMKRKIIAPIDLTDLKIPDWITSYTAAAHFAPMNSWPALRWNPIPHYLLFDKNGRIMDKAAPEPHMGPQLFDFIEKKLKKR